MEGGEIALRNLDFAAHRSLVDGHHFKSSYLPRRAARLADRLLEALEPFIIVKGANKRRPRLKQDLEFIFLCALSIKTEALISKDMFETTWPMPQSEFQELSMETEPLATVDKEAGVGDPQKVKLALLPGIRGYIYDRKLVDYHSFARRGSDGLQEPNQFSRAVVVLEG